MIVKSYSGRTVNEALEKVRQDLGKDALIIETRPKKGPGLLGGKVGYEVVAATEDNDHRSKNWREELLDENRSRAETIRMSSEDHNALPDFKAVRSQAAALENRSSLPESNRHPSDIESELSAIRRQLARLARGQNTPTDHLGQDLVQQLDEHQLPHETIAELDEAIASCGDRLPHGRREEFVVRYLARGLDCQGDIPWNKHRELLVVGPTGVGKTTTIAKLAGDLVLRRGRRVALVTIDTYRVGATDQLQAYADLLDIPFEIAQTPAQLKDLCSRFADYDNILIDTAGRSPADTTRLTELRGFLHAVPGMKVMLTIAATCGQPEFASIVERFSILPIEHTTITKIDENASSGRLIACLRRHRLPLNYITNGQEVPRDFATADAEIIARSVLAPHTTAAS